MSEKCADLQGIELIDVVRTECPDCVASGDTWVHLRECVACGYVGCCDNSPNKHASGHAASHPDHPVARSAEPGETWIWCYVHEMGRQS